MCIQTTKRWQSVLRALERRSWGPAQRQTQHRIQTRGEARKRLHWRTFRVLAKTCVGTERQCFLSRNCSRGRDLWNAAVKPLQIPSTTMITFSTVEYVGMTETYGNPYTIRLALPQTQPGGLRDRRRCAGLPRLTKQTFRTSV